MISFQNVNFRYDKNLNTLNDVNIDIDNGDRLAFIGENSYNGKDIFLRLITGLEKKYEGEIFLNSQNLRTIDFSKDYSMGYIPSKIPFFFHKTVKQNIEYVFNVRGIFDNTDERIKNILERFGISSLIDVRINKLSNLQKLQVALVRLAVRNIDTLIVENYIDNLSEEEIGMIIPFFIELNRINKDMSMIIVTDNEYFIKEMNLNILKLENGQIIKESQDN